MAIIIIIIIIQVCRARAKHVRYLHVCWCRVGKKSAGEHVGVERTGNSAQ